MSVWSDSRIIKISKELIPTTDEVWRLQTKKDADALIFQEMANSGHYRGEGTTRQGIYICTPSGKLLSSINSLNPDEVLEKIRYGLELWNKKDNSEKISKEKIDIKVKHRWEDSFPNDGLILESFNRDLFSDPPKKDDRNSRWNMDHVWFNKYEARKWIPSEPKIGLTYKVPEIISNRLFCFHIVDNVRGQTIPFAPQELKNSEIIVLVTDVRESIVDITIKGSSVAKSDGPWLLGDNDWKPKDLLDHGMSSEIFGKATYNLKQNKFTDFEIVSIGKRFGKTEHNSRINFPDTSYVGFLFQINRNDKNSKIAPAFIDIYNADWVVKP